MTGIALEQQILRVSKSLPELPLQPRKNIFDILGVRNKETVNSRVLAYFLDPEEEHSFGTLFLDSLLEVVAKIQFDNWDSKQYAGEFRVTTEDSTINSELLEDRQKRIDISISGNRWRIIIENKLYHILYNPLKAYMQHAKKNKDHVLGIILSLNRITKKVEFLENVPLVNITHQEWMHQVQANLMLSDIKNDTDVLYLREYLKTIQTHYRNKMEEPINNILIQALIDHKEAVKEIEDKKTRAIKFIDEQLILAFAKWGYIKKRVFFCHPENENLCFWVIPSSEVLSDNHLNFGFEVYHNLKNDLGKEAIHNIQNVLREKVDLNKFFFNNPGEPSHKTRLITYRQNNFLSGGKDFKTELASILDSYFFSQGGIEETVLSLFPKTINLKPAREYKA